MERRLALIYIVGAMSTLAVSLWQPLLPLYLDIKGLLPWEVGLGVSMMMNMAFITAFIAGYVVDKLGWERSLIISQIIIASTTLSLVIVNNILVLIVISIGFGLAIALLNQSSVKVVALSTEIKERGTAFSSYLIATGFSRITGSSLSGYVATMLGYGSLFFISSILTLPAILLLKYNAINLESKKKVSFNRALNLISKDLRLKLLAFTLFIHDFSVFILIPYLALFAKYSIGLGEKEVGLLSGISNLATMFSFFLSGWIADKIGGTYTLILHFISTSLSYIFYSTASDFLSAATAYAMIGVAVSFDMPARRLLLTKYAPKEYIGAISGFADTLAGIGTMFSPLVGGHLWAISYSAPLIVGSLFNLIAVPLAFSLKVIKRRRTKEKL